MKSLHVTIGRIIILGGAIIIAWVVLRVVYVGESGDAVPSGFQIRPLSQGFSLPDGETQPDFDSALADYPAPEKFTRIRAGQERLNVSGTCKDAYVAILIFESGVDYRRQPETARYNRAFSCPKNGLFRQTIDTESLDLKNIDHYVIIADQGAQNIWHNPR